MCPHRNRSLADSRLRPILAVRRGGRKVGVPHPLTVETPEGICVRAHSHPGRDCVDAGLSERRKGGPRARTCLSFNRGRGDGPATPTLHLSAHRPPMDEGGPVGLRIATVAGWSRRKTPRGPARVVSPEADSTVAADLAPASTGRLAEAVSRLPEVRRDILKAALRNSHGPAHATIFGSWWAATANSSFRAAL